MKQCDTFGPRPAFIVRQRDGGRWEEEEEEEKEEDEQEEEEEGEENEQQLIALWILSRSQG